ncbi:MAG TPA: mucoidy inhibitor MuiA family protein [Candidatus Polarisedimenticolaceae bacterium]|nr:mucoidy inhibitor MuiA family protein [Candidatus Polarisedimenticolaceae bacterium]
MTTRQTRRTVVALLAALVLPLAASAATLSAKNARIVEVTVYPDRAEVVREATLELPSGASTVEFNDIPLNAENDSLRVNAKGVPALLGAVTIRRHAETPTDTPELQALRDEVKRLEGELAKLASQERVANDLREFLKSLRATAAERESGNIGAGKSDPASIGATYDLLAKKLADLADQDLAREQAKDKLNRELEVARAKAAAGPGSRSIESRVAAAELETKQAGSITLRLAYLVTGASWSPAYRATLDPATGEVGLVSEAVVRQGTGESWPGVALRLSTAAPARGVAPPEMMSRLLRPYEPKVVAGTLDNATKAKFNSDFVAGLPVAGRYYQNVIGLAPGVQDPDGPGVPPPPMPTTIAEAGLVRSAYNVAFEVPGRSDVPADNADHRVVLRQEELAGAVSYRIAPAIEPAAFLTSVVRAPQQYPLLSGAMRVLAGGAYLGVYALPETAPGAELTVPFGRDNRIKVDRVKQPQDHTTEGLTGKTHQIAYAYKTSVENLRDRDVTVIVEDRVPVSEDERVVVDIAKTTTPDHKPSASRPGVLLWKLNLAPHEKKDVVLAYTVRYPKEMLVAGLE